MVGPFAISRDVTGPRADGVHQSLCAPRRYVQVFNTDRARRGQIADFPVAEAGRGKNLARVLSDPRGRSGSLYLSLDGGASWTAPAEGLAAPMGLLIC